MGIPTYIELLKNTDAAVRSAAVFMLWHFPELSHKILVYLEEAFLTENDPFVRQEISIAIQRMQTQSRDF